MKTEQLVASGGGLLQGLGRRWVGFFAEAERIREEQEQSARREPKPVQRAAEPAAEGDTLFLDGPRTARVTTTVAHQRVGLLDGLRRLLDEQALIVLGPKGSGKTTLSMALLNAVIAGGHHVVIIDPHAELNPWPEGITKYGSGLNYGEIDRVLRQLFDEMRLRYQRGQEHRREPLYVFIDEVPSIREECPSWGRVFAKLLREARKVGIHIVVLSQSFLVEDLGINGDSRTNLTVVALGKAVSRYLAKAQHLNEREKTALIEATRSLPRPAIIDSGDVPAIFEVTGADRVQTRMQPRPWRFEEDETELLAGLLGARLSGLSGVPAEAVQAAFPQTNRQTDGQTDGQERVKRELRRLYREGYGREEARVELKRLGLGFDNKLWTTVRVEEQEPDDEG